MTLGQLAVPVAGNQAQGVALRLACKHEHLAPAAAHDLHDIKCHATACVTERPDQERRAPGDAAPLGDIVHYAMGDAGLILPAAVSAAMALQIHWALPRASSQLAQAPGAFCPQSPQVHMLLCIILVRHIIERCLRAPSAPAGACCVSCACVSDS